MAGIYVVLQGATEARLRRVARCLRFGSEAEAQFADDFGYLWLGHDEKELYGPAVDFDSGVHVVVGGRTSWPTALWERAKQLPYEGGLASRILLERFLYKGPMQFTPFNGAAAIVIWESKARRLHLWTDQLGYYPCFLYMSHIQEQCVITSFPDALREDPVAGMSPDLCSMAEFLSAWRVTPPFTYYREVRHAGAATYWNWEFPQRLSRSQVYWRPFEDGFYDSEAEAADALAEAVSTSVGERTAAADRSVLFVSGGADSRVMLFAAHDPGRITGVNLFEYPTPESATAKALCETAGVTYLGYERDSDYYPRLLQEIAHWSGAMWSAEDGHYLGVHDVVVSEGARLVMTACTTDWLFKGYGLEKRYLRLGRRNLPFFAFLPERVDAFLPNHRLSVPDQFQEEVETRFQDWFVDCPRTFSSDQDRLQVEDRRIRPACYTVSVSGQIMFRIFPYDTFLADSRVADCYSRILPAWKLNASVWDKAAATICVVAKDIENSNFGWRLGAGHFQKLAAFAKGWVLRRLSPGRGQPRPRSGHPPSAASWPDFGWYAENSQTLGAFWEATPHSSRELMRILVGYDPWARPLSEWREQSALLFRILTLLAHWRDWGPMR